VWLLGEPSRRHSCFAGAPGWLGLCGVLLTGCPAATTATTTPAPYVLPARPLCQSAFAGVPEVRGHLQDDRLVEVSGVVASPSTPDLLWVHNDSGDAATLYSIGQDGRARGRVQMPFEAHDLEDIAVASCPDRTGPCLYLADTGNNAHDRTDAVVVIVREPVLPAAGVFADDATATIVGRIDASVAAGLPAGIDVEAMVALPDGSAVFLIEKIDDDRARVFARRAPYDDDGRFVVVGTIRTESPSVEYGRMITAADMHPSGRALLVRTYTGVFETRVDAIAAWFELGDVLLNTLTFGPLSEPQGEAIAYDEGGHIITISEARDRPASDVAVNRLVCGG
jgi:hypothetical protein